MGQSTEDDWGKYLTDAPIVSVWLGNFPSADTYRDYFAMRAASGADDEETCQFWDDVGICWVDPAIEECSGYVGEAVPIDKLIGDSFSYLNSFREPLLAACRSTGIARANIVVLLYGFEYSAADRFQSTYMKFVGVFSYDKEA